MSHVHAFSQKEELVIHFITWFTDTDAWNPCIWSLLVPTFAPRQEVCIRFGAFERKRRAFMDKRLGAEDGARKALEEMELQIGEVFFFIGTNQTISQFHQFPVPVPNDLRN